jgi:hypothetical protein
MAVMAASDGRFLLIDGVSERGKERERRGGVGEGKESGAGSLGPAGCGGDHGNGRSNLGQ